MRVPTAIRTWFAGENHCEPASATETGEPPSGFEPRWPAEGLSTVPSVTTRPTSASAVVGTTNEVVG
jgi:hypothetical protein